MSHPNYDARIVNRRIELGLTQKRVANVLGVDTKTVNNWERGRNTPRLTPAQTAALCGLYRWTVQELATHFEEILQESEQTQKGGRSDKQPPANSNS